MFSYCLKCGKNTDSKNAKFVRTKNERIMLLSEFSVCRKLTFFKDQEGRGVLSSFLGVKVPV